MRQIKTGRPKKGPKDAPRPTLPRQCSTILQIHKWKMAKKSYKTSSTAAAWTAAKTAATLPVGATKLPGYAKTVSLTFVLVLLMT